MSSVFYNNKMRFKERDANSKRKYSKISLCKRKKLIDLVIHEGQSLIKSTKKLNINLSTARLILKLYKSTGSFHMKNFKHPPKEEGIRQQLSEAGSQDFKFDLSQEANPLVQSAQQSIENHAKMLQESSLAQNLAIYPCVWYYFPYYISM